jgi:hypothetical protein
VKKYMWSQKRPVPVVPLASVSDSGPRPVVVDADQPRPTPVWVRLLVAAAVCSAPWLLHLRVWNVSVGECLFYLIGGFGVVGLGAVTAVSFYGIFVWLLTGRAP